jgi:hypothetical protein
LNKLIKEEHIGGESLEVRFGLQNQLLRLLFGHFLQVIELCDGICATEWHFYWCVSLMLIYTHCWELMNPVVSHGSSSLPFVMKVMVCHFVSDSHEVMTALIVVLPLIVVVEISLQLHRSSLMLILQ